MILTITYYFSSLILMVITLELYPLSKFQLFNAILLTRVTLVHIKHPELAFKTLLNFIIFQKHQTFLLSIFPYKFQNQLLGFMKRNSTQIFEWNFISLTQYITIDIFIILHYLFHEYLSLQYFHFLRFIHYFNVIQCHIRFILKYLIIT